jgi:hypothetical protein
MGFLSRVQRFLKHVEQRVDIERLLWRNESLINVVYSRRFGKYGCLNLG